MLRAREGEVKLGPGTVDIPALALLPAVDEGREERRPLHLYIALIFLKCFLAVFLLFSFSTFSVYPGQQGAEQSTVPWISFQPPMQHAN